MLRRLRIGTRVNMLIMLPLAALLALAAGAFWSTQRAGLGSAEYQRLQLIDDLRSTVSQPTASLLPTWAKVSEVAALGLGPTADDAETRARVEGLLGEIELLRGTQADVLSYWEQQQLDAVTGDVMASAGAAGVAFWQVYDEQFIPALRNDDEEGMTAALVGLQAAFDTERAVTERISRLVETERELQKGNIELFIERLQIVLIVGVGVLVVITVLLAVFVRRSIVRPIKSLAGHATNVADQSLPSAVRQAAEGDQPRLEVFKTEKGGELADLGRSFNSMQEVALELAVDQARARQTVSENLVNIARRNQTLLGRTLSVITDLEQHERDPGRLESLFSLDHLATRMRRNAQSLLVLADAEPTRRFAPPAAIADVVRGALSEVERYTQVDLGDLGEGYLQGALVPEVAHLLAELIENATSFSPPTSRVSIVGRGVADGHQLVIIDYGLGMSAEELSTANNRLSKVTSFEQESSRMLGFHVVSRLAARHGMKVMLTATPGGRGTTAIVRLPASIMESKPATSAAPVVPVAPSAAPVAPVAPAPPVAAEPVGYAPAAPTVPVANTPLPVRTPQPPQFTDVPRPVEQPVAPTLAPAAAAAPAWTPTTLGATEYAPMTADRIREVVEGPAAAAPAVPTVTHSGLAKRVRGAQMPDVGAGNGPVDVAGRAPDSVRSSLADLQRGVGLGRLGADPNGQAPAYQREEDR
jgi:hypothetical protein